MKSIRENKKALIISLITIGIIIGLCSIIIPFVALNKNDAPESAPSVPSAPSEVSSESSDDAPESVLSQPPEDSVTDEYTLLIYMCGSTLESYSGAASGNIAEMLSADIPEKTNVIIQTGGASKWFTDGISPMSGERFTVENHALSSQWRKTPAPDMGDGETLTSFISWGIEKYPAKKYGLIFWDHGGGSISGVCFDENHNMDSLTLSEINKALEAAQLPQKFEFIGFDACLMATLDTAAAIEPYALNMIASEENAMNAGWDYNALLCALGKDDLYGTVLSSYAEKSKKQYYTLSCVDLSRLSANIEAFSALLEKMKEEKPRDVINAINDATHFGGTKSEYYDLGNIISAFGGKAFDGIQTANGRLRDDATGLSVYFPLNSQSDLQSYIESAFYDKYAEFIDDFFKSQSENTIAFSNYAAQEGNKLKVTLTKDSVLNVGSVEYALFAFEGEDNEDVFLYGTDNDTDISGNQIIINFTGCWVEFGGHPLYCKVTDENDGVSIFEGQITADGREAKLLFAFDGNSKQASIVGITYADENYSRISDLTAGAEITVIKKQAEGESFINASPPENTFTYDGQQIEVCTLDDGYYQYTAYVLDIYGNRFTAGTAVIKLNGGEAEIETVTGGEPFYPK